MSRFDQAALIATGMLVAALYGIVASDSFSNRSEPQRATKTVDPAGPKAENAAPEERLTDTGGTGSGIKPQAVYSLPASVKAYEILASGSYRLQDVRQHGEVPRVFVRTLPHDLSSIRRAEERKRVFIKLTLPLILHANDLVRSDRQRIKMLRDRHHDGLRLTVTDRAWLAQKMDEYALDSLDFDQLLRRADVVPPSLALAQSAEESGWGTSRFAREGNALFGQRIWRDGAGIVPRERAEGENYRVRSFDHLMDGVKSYVRNLNTHPAYKRFRSMRASMRRAGASPDGVRLVEALRKYSERGDHYVDTIRTIIRVNELTHFDRVRLQESADNRNKSPGT